MAFVKRKINVTITLGTGDFGAGPAGKSSTVKAAGLRCSVQITKAGNPSADQAIIRVWGLTQSIMNAATDLGKPLARTRNNTVVVEAGDDTAGLSTVFTGTIMTAYGDFSDQPNASLSITALSNQVAAMKPVAPSSFTGATDAAVAATQIAQLMGKNLKNWGVTGVVLSNPYLPGTAVQQMNRLAKAANFYYDASDQNIVEIWPKDGVRGGLVPDIGPNTGLVGYPEFCDVGVNVKTLFMPGLTLGGQFNLTTSITHAQGSWRIMTLVYNLESETPGGAWWAEMTARRPSANGG